MEPWTKQRLEGLIADKIEEGPTLDYKAAAALDRSDQRKTEVTKDVSAFANAAGGTIIYGLREYADKARKHLPESLDPIDRREYSREWLDQVIGLVSPRIAEVRIFPVAVGSADWEVCYVVEIPQGRTAHQARDLRYYRRYNFESVPMADYEIRDVMNRRRHPHLDFRIRLQRSTKHERLMVLGKFINRGEVLARHYALQVALPTVVEGTKLYKEGLIPECRGDRYFWRVLLRAPNDLPLFPNSDTIAKEEIAPAYEPGVPEPAGETISCVLFADEMPPIRREVRVEDALKGWV